MIPGGNVRDSITDFLNYASAFVTEHGGRAAGNGPVLGRQIRVTNSTGNELDVDIARPKIAQADIVSNLQIGIQCGKNRGFHVRPPVGTCCGGILASRLPAWDPFPVRASISA
jgi:hypothetical protein